MAPFSVVLDRKWPGRPAIWVGTSQDQRNTVQENFGLIFRTLSSTGQGNSRLWSISQKWAKFKGLWLVLAIFQLILGCFLAMVAKALAIHRIEKPRNPENRRKLENIGKILYFANFWSIFPIFGLFLSYFLDLGVFLFCRWPRLLQGYGSGWETAFYPANCSLPMRVSNPSPVLDKNSAPLGAELHPELGLGSGGRLLRHFQTPVLYWINFSLWQVVLWSQGPLTEVKIGKSGKMTFLGSKNAFFGACLGTI